MNVVDAEDGLGVQRDVLEIELFGGFTLRYAGQPLPPVSSRPARLLFAWLALHPGRAQPRSLLAAHLWPDTVEARARRRLSHALWQLQDCLGECSPDHTYLVTPGDAVLFDASAPYWLDVEEFEDRLDGVDATVGVDDRGLRSLRRCVTLYQGDLLAGSYEPWVVAEQERLQQRYVTALGRLVEGCKQRGSFQEALSFAQRLTHEAPLREDIHREVMRLCVLLGQPSQALEQFDRCRSVLLEELGTPPSAATVELRDRISQSRDVSVSSRTPVEELVSRRLIGRDEQRVALVDQLERTLSGAAGTVLLEGEPGIGKTQLLVQAADDARWRGFTVLWGACAGSGIPYAAVREALLPELLPVRVAQLRAHVDGVWLQEAGRLLPALAPPPPSAGADARPPARLTGLDGAARMREALVRVIAGLAAIDPLMLVIEDAHLADQESLALLDALGRQLELGRLLVVLSFRDVEAREDDRIWTGLRTIDRDSRPVRLKLEPLTVFETSGLLREVLGTFEVPAAFAEEVHREGGGNPLYVLELLRALRDAGSLGDQARDRLQRLTVPVTDGLRELIGGRLDRLDDEVAGIVELGAVLGTEFDLDTLRLGSGSEPGQLAAGLAQLVRRNLVEVSGDVGRFTHAATRRVVLDRLDAGTRRALHGVAGDALESTHPEQVERLAAHFQQADQPQRALPYVRQAAEQAVRIHAYGTAADHLLAAAELADRVPMLPEQRFPLLAELEEVLGILGRRGEQEETLVRMEAVAGGDRQQLVELRLRQATYLGHVDRFEEAVDAARDAARLAAGDDPRTRGRALAALGQVLGWAGENTRSVDVLREAADLLDDDGAGAEAGQARFALGTALRFLQRFEQADAELHRALELAERDDDRLGIVHALGALADLHAETGDTEGAVELHGRAVGMARRIGYRHREGVGLVNLGTVQLNRSRPVAALESYDQAAAVFEALGNRRGVAMVRLNRAWLRHRWLGPAGEAERDARSAHAYFDEVGNRGQVAVCLETLAGIARELGQLTRAAEHLAEGRDAACAADDRRAEAQILRGTAELELSRGQPGQAAAVAAQALAIVRQLGLSEFAADLLSLAAVAALMDGDAERAWVAAKDALGEVSTSSEPHRIHQRIAAVAAATGRKGTARRHQQNAYRLLLDALADADERTRNDAIQTVPEHREIVHAGRAVSPRTVEARMARRDAPHGRALEPTEMVMVTLPLGPPPDSLEDRRQELVSILEQVRGHDAEATVADLASVLEVSESTIRRDLRALRAHGVQAGTRGSRTG